MECPDASAFWNGDVPPQSKIESPFPAFNLSFGFFRPAWQKKLPRRQIVSRGVKRSLNGVCGMAFLSCHFIELPALPTADLSMKIAFKIEL
jgi:hypothetical protein